MVKQLNTKGKDIKCVKYNLLETSAGILVECSRNFPQDSKHP
jgi:hypothetical protein